MEIKYVAMRLLIVPGFINFELPVINIYVTAQKILNVDGNMDCNELYVHLYIRIKIRN